MIEPNPYAPPLADGYPSAGAAPPADGVPAYKLYTPGQATLAAFLGTPAAGLYLMAVNRRRLGHAQAARNTLIAAVAATAVVMVVAFVLPDGIGRAIPIAGTIAVGQYAKADTPLLDAHRGRGGGVESGWKAAGIGLLGCVAAMAVIVALLLITGEI
jgi:hypothetical protein